MSSLFREDVQRWIVPQQIADPSEVTFSGTMRLLWQHMGLRAMLWYRFGSWCAWHGIPFIPGFVRRFLYRFFGLDIVMGIKIGGGLYIPHPNGTVIVAEEIGKNCNIIANVTIGMRNEWTFPIIGDNVFIGAGARILGGIRIGDNSVIGANSVVIQDVPDNTTVVGIPARVVRHSS
jgi:serine O-acetyltransferase